jgi:tRNA A37 threonylcarbamoyladenosine dehydratase
LASCKGANAVNLSKTRVVIVGAGQAGGRAAEAFRAVGHVGPITLIDDEAIFPMSDRSSRNQFCSTALNAARDMAFSAPPRRVPKNGSPGLP